MSDILLYNNDKTGKTVYLPVANGCSPIHFCLNSALDIYYNSLRCSLISDRELEVVGKLDNIIHQILFEPEKDISNDILE